MFEARVKRKFNINFSDRWAIIGAQIVASPNSKKPPFWVYNFSANQLYFSSLHIAKWSVLDYFGALIKYKPKYLIGYTNSIFELAKEMDNNNKTFCMKAVITNAEPLYDYQKFLICKVFMCPIIETYGQAELVSFANSFPNGKMYESPEMGISETIDPKRYKDGKYGQLIATGLLNKAMPLIRYNTNDLISCNSEKRINGDLPFYGKILGRKDDLIILKDGKKIVQIDGIFTKDVGIDQGQIIQEDYSQFIIKVVPGKDWSDSSEYKLRKKLSDRIGSVEVKVELCRKIEPNWAGKHRVIISKIK